jgi:predicted CopG family antitoxin
MAKLKSGDFTEPVFKEKMTSRTIKISEGNYKRLLNIAAELQKQREERVSFDDALQVMEAENMDKKKKKLSDLAGRWADMSDEEAGAILKEIYGERRVISRRL